MKKLYSLPRLGILFGFLLLLVSSNVFGQANVVVGFNGVPSTYFPNFEAADQRTINVRFDAVIAGGPILPTGDWLVTVNGVNCLVQTAIRINANDVRIQFRASDANPGLNFILPGQPVTVKFTNISGTLNANTSAIIPAQNNYSPQCSDIDQLSRGFYAANDVCAPVTMNFLRWTYETSMEYVNSSKYNTNVFKATVLWGDPAASLTGQDSYPSDNVGGLVPTYSAAGVKLTTQPVGYATIKPTFTYPATYTLAAPTSCEFIANLTPAFGGLGGCGSKIDQVLFPSYDTDNKNTGILNLPPLVANTDKVCVGTNVGMKFNDNTSLNCRVAVESNAPNQLTRNIRIIYGSTNNGGVGNIPDVFVTLPAALGGGTTRITNNDGTGTFANAGFFPASLGSADFNGVINLPANVTVSSGSAFMGTIFTTDPTKQVVGQKLFVRLEYWDVCNPYDGVTATGQEFIESFVLIIPKPTTPVAIDKALCNGSSLATVTFDVTAASVSTSTAINWYKALPAVAGNANQLVNPSGTNATTFPATSFAGGIVNTVAGNYVMYATQVTGATNACESTPVPITLTIREALSLATNPGASVASVCRTNAVTFTYPGGAPVAPPSQPFGGATKYTWSVPGTWAINSGQGTATMVATPGAGAPAGANTISVVWEYATGSLCTSGSKTVNVTVLDPPSISSSTGNQTVCEGSSTTFGVTTAGAGLTFQWQEKVPAGAFTNIVPGPNYLNSTTATLTVTPPNGTFNGNQYQCIVSGTCSPTATSTARTLTVNTKPVVTVQPVAATACNGTATTFSVTATGTGLTYQWKRDNGGGPVNITAALDGAGTYTNFTTTTLTVNAKFILDTFDYSVVVSGTCAPNATSASANLTVKGPTTTINGGATTGSVCTGNSFALTGVETFQNGALASRIWTGTLGGVPQLDATVQGWFGGSPTSTLSPTFNVGTVGTYALTLTTTENGAPVCTSAATITITVSQVNAAPTATPSTVCSGVNSAIAGVATGGSGTYTTFLWTGTGATFLNNTAIQNPTFNDGFAGGAAGGGPYTLIFKVTDNNGCFGTSAPINVTVNPAPTINTNAVLDKTVCSNVVGGLVLSDLPATAIASANYNYVSRTPAGALSVVAASVIPAAGKTNNYANGDKYKNITNGALGITYVVAGVGANACVGPTKSIVVTVNPEPDFNTTTPSICSNVALGIDLNGNAKGTSVAAVTYNIVSITPQAGLANTAGTPAVAGTGQANTAIQNEKWRNRTANPLTVAYVITAVSAVPCTAFSNFTITVTVNPEPDFNSTTPAICSNVALGTDLNANKKGTSVAAATYNIISIAPAVGLTNTAGTPAVIGAGQANTALQNEKWQNRTTGALHVIYTIRPSSAVPCAAIGNDFTIDVTVNPEPDFNSTTLTLCSSATAVGVDLNTLQKGSSVAATTYNIISIGNVAGLTAIAGTPVTGAGKPNTEIADDKWKNITSAAAHIIYTIRPSSAAPCAAVGNDFTVDVTVNPEPDFNSTTPTFCSNIALGLDLNSNKKGTSVAATTYNIVSIGPAAGLTNTAGTPAVPGNGQANTALQNEKWQNRTPNPLNVTYTITPVSAIPCTAFTNFTISVTINPEPDFNSTTPTICSNVALGIDLNSNKKGTSVAAGPTGYNIISIVPAAGLTNTAGAPATVGGGKANTALQNEKWQNKTTGALHVIYTIRPSSAAPCTAIGNDFTIDVTVNPEPDFNSTTLTICSQTLVGVDLNTLQKGSSIAAANFTIVSITNTSALIATAGTPVTGGGKTNLEISDDAWKNTTGAVAHIIYTITAVSAVPCTGLTNFTVDVTVNPEPTLATPQTKTICSGDAVNYTVLLNPAGLPAASTFSWGLPTMSDASPNGSNNLGTTTPLINDVLVNSSNTLAITATYTIDVQGSAALGSCPSLAPIGSRQVVITVNPVPVQETVIGTATVCQSTNPVIYSVTNFNSLDATTSYSWRIGSASFNRLSGGGGAVPGGGFSPFVASEGILVLNFPTIATGNIDVIKKNNFGCQTLANPLPVTVVTAPIASTISADPPPYCNGENNVKFFIAAPNGTSTYNWSIAGSASISGSSVGTIIDVNLAAAGPSATISVTETNTAGCTTPYTPKVISINPIPDFVVSSNSPICSGVNIDISISETTGVAGTNFNWIIQNNPGAVTGAVAGGPLGPYVNPTPLHLIQALNNPTNSDQIVTYRITPTSGAGCDGTFKDIGVTVNPIPTISIVSSAVPLCSGSATNIQLFNPNSVPGTTFSWIIQSNPGIVTGAIPGGGLVAGQSITQTLVNPTAIAQTVKYRITPSASGCGGGFTDVDVVVNPTPNITNLPAPTAICNGTALNFTPAITGFTDYSWTSSIIGTITPTTVTGSGITPITDSPINTGSSPATVTYRITPFFNGCAGAFKDYVVTVNPTPIVAPNGNVAVCSGGAVGAITFSANTGGGETFSWTNSNPLIGLPAGPTAGNIGAYTAPVNISGTPIVGTISVTATKSTCVSAPSTFTISINPEPVVTTIVNQTFCPGNGVNIPLASNVGGATINWTNTNPLIGIGASGVGSIVYIAPVNNTGADIVGTINVTATANTCLSAGANAKSFTITIHPSPIMNSVSNITVCSGTTVPLVIFSANTSGGETFSWTNDNAGIGLPLGPTTGNIGSYLAPVNTSGTSITGNISVTGTKNSCTGPAKTFTITILAEPVGVGTTVTVCSDVAVGVNLSTLITGSLGASTYNITSITNTSGLVASAGTPANGSGFSATEIQDDKWTNTTGIQRDIIYRVVPVSGSAPACTGSFFDVVVHVDPEPVVVGVSNQQFCAGAAVNIPLSSNVGGATMNWTNTNPLIGIGVSGSGNIVYTAPANNTGANIVGTITVSAVGSGCTSAGANVKSFTITIKPTPVMIPNSNVVVCSGGTVGTISFSANTGGSENFNWTNNTPGIGLAATGSGSTIASFATNVNITGSPIIATIGVTPDKNGCTGVAGTFTITVNPEPVVTAVGAQQFCPGVAVSIPLTSNVGGAAINWTNSNPSIGLGASGSGSIAYVAPVNNTGLDIVGTITVTATANTCTSTGANSKSFTITIHPSPVMNSVSNVTVCSGTIVPAINFSANTSGGETFSWTNDNAGIGLPTGPTAGNIASYTAPVNTTGSSITGNLSVTATKNSCTGLAKAFTITILAEPVGVGTAVTVCSDVAVGVNLSTLITGGLGASTYNIPSIQNTSGLASSAGAPATGTGFSATEIQNDKWTNTTGVQHDIIYRIVPVSGSVPACTGAFFDVTVHVDAEPVVVGVSNQLFCPGAAVNIPLSSNIGTATMNWTNSNPSIGIAASGTGNIVYTAPVNNTGANIVGIITVTATANTCVSAGGNLKTFTITIKPTPVMNPNSNVPVCSAGTVPTITFSANTGGSETFNWTNDTPAIGLAASGIGNIVSFVAAANNTPLPIVATISVTPTKNSCTGVASTFTITVNPQSTLSSSLAPPAICSGTTFNYAATSVAAGATFAWSRAAVTGINEAASLGAGNVSEVLTNTTSSPVNVTYLYVTSANGCSSSPQSVVVSVTPSVVVNPVTPVVVCSGGTVGPIAFTSSLDPGVTYNWTNDNTGINLPASGTGPISFTAAINTGSVPMIGNISVTGNQSSCTGGAANFTITVNPQPVLQISAFPDICSTNANTSNPTNIVLGTNGTSVNVAATGYQLIALQYSTGGPFASGLPTGFTRTGSASVGTFGDINIVKNDTYNNVSGGQVTVRYTIQGTSVAGCKSSTQTYDVIVNPQPHFDPTSAPLCSGVASGITLTATPVTSPGISQYVLKSVVLGGSLTAAGTNAAIGTYASGNFLAGDKFTNTSNASANVTYTIAAISTATPGCLGPDQTVIFTVNPAPGMPTLDTKACSGAISTIILADNFPISAAAVSYDINSIVIGGGMTPGGGNAATGNTNNFNKIATDVFTNSTNVPQIVTYGVVPVASTGCKGPTINIILTVEPTVVAAPLNHKIDICSFSASTTDATDVELLSPTVPSAGPITFSYTASASPIGSVSGFAPAQSGLAAGFHITDNLINNTNAVATVTYLITAIANGASNGAGCNSVAVSMVVTVEPKPKMTATPSTKTVCELVSPNILLKSLTVPSGAIPIEFLLVSVVPTNVGGVVTGFTAAGSVFANNSTLGDLLSSTSTIMETVTYTFRPRMTGGAGCIGDDVVVNVNVNPLPNLTALGVPAAICSGDQFDITLVSDVAGTVSTWPAPVTAPTAGSVTGTSAGAGDEIFQVLFNKTSPLVQTVTYTVTPKVSGCTGPQLTINIPVNPVPNVLGTGSPTICNGGTLTVPLSSKVASGVTYAWTVDDPSGIGPAGSFDGGGPTINQLFANTTGSQAVVTYTIVPTLAAPGTSTGSCIGDNKLMSVTVAPAVLADFNNNPASPNYICLSINNVATNHVSLSLQLSGHPLFDVSYKLDQLSPATSTPVSLTNQSSTITITNTLPLATQYTYTVTSVTSHINGISCTVPQNVSYVINVGSTDPTFTITTPLASCNPNRATIKYNQVAGVLYEWSFGDVDSAYVASTTVANKTIKHTYSNLTPSATLQYHPILTTSLTDPNYPQGCKSIFNTGPTVTVYPNIIVNVNANKTTICSGETISFLNSTVGATTQAWSYRVQGQTAETAMGTTANINFAFTNSTASNPIVYEVIYRADNGHCPTPDQIIPIQVYRSATAGFNEGTLPFVVNGHGLVTFTNTTVPIAPTAFIYDWTFGADSHIGTGTPPASYSGATPPQIDYTKPGVKTVVLTVTNNANASCVSTFTKTINLQLLPLMAVFTVTPSESCAPTKITVATVTATGDEYLWNVIDNNGRVVASSTGLKPTFNVSTEGNYLITLKTSSSLDGQVAFAPNQTVKVYPKPFASFDARPDIVYVPDTELTTFNFSSGANQFAWDFGDGTIVNTDHPPTSGDVIEPKHTYKVEGTYDIMLYAQFNHGNNIVCSDTLSHKVIAKQGGITKVPNAFTPNTGGPSGGVSGNGSFNDVFLPIVKGAEEFNMQIYDRWGNLIFESNSSQIGWDGYNKDGKLLPAGVYVYKLTLRLSDGQRSTQIGDVTMIR